MNQILVVGNKGGRKNNSTIDIKKIVLFFSVAIIVFGGFLVINGIVGLSKNNKSNEKTPVGIVDTIPTPQTPIVEDNEPPTIELSVSGENIKIIARDETEIDYIEYSWNEEEIQTAKANTDDKNRIETSIALKQGTNTLKVKAIDKAENIQEKTQEFQGKIRPTVSLGKNEESSKVIITVTCEDGISKIEFTINGAWTRIPFEDYINYTKEDWEASNVIVEYSDDGKIIKAQYTRDLPEGKNIINVYAYSLEGLVGTGDGKATYNPQH